MDTSANILGATVAKQITERTAAAVVTIGTDRFTRGDLSRVACFNFHAAARLSAVLATFTVKNTADVFARIPPSALAVPSIGAVSLAVLGACFEVKRLGGEHPLQAWVERHLTEQHPHVATFTTVKHWVAQATQTPGQGARSHGPTQRTQPDRKTHRPPRAAASRAADRPRPARRGRAG